jgi:hypothetical protein
MFIFKSSYFRYEGKFYDQLEGTGMGLCPSPNFADLVMTCLLNKISEDLEFEVLFIKKYVDDLVLSIPEDKIETLLSKFNNYNQFLQFTVEVEKDRRLPFLDMEILIGENGNITTKWFRKSISSGRILSFLSSHPRSQIANTAEGFIRRVLSLTSVEHIEEMKKLVWTLLKKNNYPTRVINILLCRVSQRMQNSARNGITTSNPTPLRFFSIHYVPGLSERIARNIQNELKDIRIAFRAPRTMDEIYTKNKDKICKWDISNVIYSIACKICPPKREYIGKTEQKLGSRKQQHSNIASKIMALKEQERNLNQNSDSSLIIIDDLLEEEKVKNQIQELCNMSAIAQHIYEFNHEFDFENTRILNLERNSRKLSTLEMLYINQRPNVNKILDLDYLSTAYKGILKTIKDKKL